MEKEIENRIAELFNELNSAVIEKEHVENIVNRLGSPNDYKSISDKNSDSGVNWKKIAKIVGVIITTLMILSILSWYLFLRNYFNLWRETLTVFERNTATVIDWFTSTTDRMFNEFDEMEEKFDEDREESEEEYDKEIEEIDKDFEESKEEWEQELEKTQSEFDKINDDMKQDFENRQKEFDDIMNENFN